MTQIENGSWWQWQFHSQTKVYIVSQEHFNDQIWFQLNFSIIIRPLLHRSSWFITSASLTTLLSTWHEIWDTNHCCYCWAWQCLGQVRRGSALTLPASTGRAEGSLRKSSLFAKVEVAPTGRQHTRTRQPLCTCISISTGSPHADMWSYTDKPQFSDLAAPGKYCSPCTETHAQRTPRADPVLCSHRQGRL